MKTIIKIKIIFLMILFFALFGWAKNSRAATHYMPDNCANFSACFSQMSGGDTLIIKNGTYNQSLAGIPNGTAGNYTTVKAENDGGVILTGSLEMANTSQYIQFEGLKWKYSDGKGVAGSYIKFFRCAFEGGGTSGYGVNVGVGSNNFPNSTSYILFEDCWFYGIGGRYNLQLYLADHIVLRRCVFRHDGGYGPNSGNPEANLSVYNTQYVEVQNCIGIDSDLTTYVYWDQSFYYIYNSQSAESTGPIYTRGAMVLNTLGCAWRSDGSASTMSLPVFSDSFGIDFSAYGFANGSSGLNLSATIANSGFDAGPYGFGDWGTGSPSVSYSFATNISDTLYNGWSSSNMSTSRGTAWLYPPRHESGSIGPTILKKIGVSGTLYGETGYNTTTSDNLWPWPYEDRIKADLASVASVGARGFATGTSRDGSPQTLTKYIWEYLGSQIPADIYGGGTSDTTPPTAPSGLSVN